MTSVTDHVMPPRRRVRPHLRARRLHRDESGAAVLEFSIVIVLLAFFLYALIAFGMMLALKQSLTSAAAEGARSVVGYTDIPTAETTAEDVALDRLDWLKASQQAALTRDATVAACANGSGQCITVTVTYPYTGNELVPPLPGLGLVTPSSLSSTAVVKISD